MAKHTPPVVKQNKPGEITTAYPLTRSSPVMTALFPHWQQPAVHQPTGLRRFNGENIGDLNARADQGMPSATGMAGQEMARSVPQMGANAVNTAGNVLLGSGVANGVRSMGSLLTRVAAVPAPAGTANQVGDAVRAAQTGMTQATQVSPTAGSSGSVQQPAAPAPAPAAPAAAPATVAKVVEQKVIEAMGKGDMSTVKEGLNLLRRAQAVSPGAATMPVLNNPTATQPIPAGGQAVQPPYRPSGVPGATAEQVLQGVQNYQSKLGQANAVTATQQDQAAAPGQQMAAIGLEQAQNNIGRARQRQQQDVEAMTSAVRDPGSAPPAGAPAAVGMTQRSNLLRDARSGMETVNPANPGVGNDEFRGMFGRSPQYSPVTASPQTLRIARGVNSTFGNSGYQEPVTQADPARVADAQKLLKAQGQSPYAVNRKEKALDENGNVIEVDRADQAASMSKYDREAPGAAIRASNRAAAADAYAQDSARREDSKANAREYNMTRRKGDNPAKVNLRRQAREDFNRQEDRRLTAAMLSRSQGGSRSQTPPTDYASQAKIEVLKGIIEQLKYLNPAEFGGDMERYNQEKQALTAQRDKLMMEFSNPPQTSAPGQPQPGPVQQFSGYETGPDGQRQPYGTNDFNNRMGGNNGIGVKGVAAPPLLPRLGGKLAQDGLVDPPQARAPAGAIRKITFTDGTIGYRMPDNSIVDENNNRIQ